MPVRIDQSLIDAYIPDDLKDVISQVETHVSDGVDAAIDQFRDSINARAEQFAKGTYDKDFEAQLDKIKADAKNQMQATQETFNTIKDQLTALKAAVSAADASGATLSASVEELSANAAKLEAALQAMDDKINNFASQGGRLVVKGLTGLLLG
ncbi:hypothetical protein [Kordiimonas marina]|uniref:hypothetical protein n=1 Tax=Kordiimonas marina TaxID=2872312 RepID=UPI001FF3DE24|nr:hypothetical protein [Kordiimonas marina]MCJ9428636.1 hypothetical protein [Kordiimonas marina]